jgi:DNA repair exonuclease SbcCD ATPase subunit
MDSNVTLHSPSAVNSKPNSKHIALYHGRVNGAVYFNGMTCNDGTAITIPNTVNKISGNKTITPSTFEPYDLALLGDIHKHQFLTPTVGYAGSLIQQNIGETIKGHGLIKWSLDTCSGIHIPIANTWSYVNIDINNKRASYLCTAPDGNHLPNCHLTKNISIRILYKNTPESYLMDYITLMKMHHNVIDYRWNNDEQPIQAILPLEQSSNLLSQSQSQLQFQENSQEELGQSSSLTRVQAKSNSLIDITSPEVQIKYLEEIVRINEPTITSEDFIRIKELNLEHNRTLRDSNKQYNNYAFNGHYKIKRLEFSNLFSFGEKNVIDFTQFHGIVGIIAPNHLGKSSILDIIVYTLFDEFTRKGSTKDIININKDDFRVRLDITIAQWTYTIIKTGSRTRIGASVKVEFYRTHDINNIIERLEEDNALKTKERIAEYFGCYEDIIHTSFSIQHDNACFIDSSNVKRKDELERIMRFEIVKKLYEHANQRYNKDKAVYEHIRKKINSDEIPKLKKEKTKLTSLLDIIKTDKEYAKTRIQGLHETILEESQKLHTECNKFLEDNNETETKELLECLEEELLDIETKIQDLQITLQSTLSVTQQEQKQEQKDASISITDKTNLVQEEGTILKNISDTNKKIKLVDQTLEKLYKTRKPLNTKIPSSISDPLEYLAQKSSKITSEIVNLENQMNTNTEIINQLQEKVKLIDINNENILALEKKLTKLPDSLSNIINIAIQSSISGNSKKSEKKLEQELKQEYLDNLECLLDTIQSNSKPITIQELINSSEYLEYEQIANKYYLVNELLKYNSNSSQADIIAQQEKLESENSRLRIEVKDLPSLESKVKSISTQITKQQVSLRLLETDIANLATNAEIDIEIHQHKQLRNENETSILEQEAKLKKIKTLMNQMNEINQLELQARKLALDIKEAQTILEEFEKYRAQIEENKPIQTKIALLKDELREFNEVLALVEKREQTEQMALNRVSTMLEQMKKDIQEGRAMEANLRIQEIYKNALKELPYILLGKIQPLLEKKVNDLLSITTDFSVRFDMSDNKIDIYLDRSIYKDKSRNIIINNASGFERFMASLAIRMALLELSNLPKINFLAIDEGWSSFDTHNINNVSMILDYLTTKFDFVLTISHLIQIKEHCDIQISLRRDEKGFSKIIY